MQFYEAIPDEEILSCSYNKGTTWQVVPLELIAGFEPATSSLPRSRAETRRRKNKPIYLRKVFAINHNI